MANRDKPHKTKSLFSLECYVNLVKLWMQQPRALGDLWTT